MQRTADVEVGLNGYEMRRMLFHAQPGVPAVEVTGKPPAEEPPLIAPGTRRPPHPAQIMRGAVVGGSGAINGGYFCRGLPGDFDGWELPGWAWNDVLPHFIAIETDLYIGGPLHGSDGPILVRRVAEFDGCTESFVRAVGDAGYRWISDLNGSAPAAPLPPGVGAVPLNINGGTRVGPGGAYLQPAMARTNLTLLANTRVGRVRIVNGRAVGVECVAPVGATELTADRMILCAGAIGSAHLLMLSGIGAEAVLRSAGIPVLVNLPVGRWCVDHPEWDCRWLGRRPMGCRRWKRCSQRRTGWRYGRTLRVSAR